MVSYQNSLESIRVNFRRMSWLNSKFHGEEKRRKFYRFCNNLSNFMKFHTKNVIDSPKVVMLC